MKALLYFDPTLTSGPKYSSMGSTGFSKVRPALLRNYSPKYLRNFPFLPKQGSTQAKLKRTKIIRKFSAHPLDRGPEWRPIIANKIKTVKTLIGSSQFTNQFVQKTKFLSYLASIHMLLPYDPRPYIGSPKEEFCLIQTCHNMKRLKHLKNFEFSRLSRSIKGFIQELNASPRLLKSLKNLILSCEWKGAQDVEMMNIMKDNKNLLRYMTSLKLATLNSPSHYKAFQAFTNSCPNLQTLSFQFCCRDIIYNPLKADRYSGKCFPVEINYLDAIKTFQNLRSLDLHIADTFTFLSDFALPPLVENLLLNFGECLSIEILSCFLPNNKGPQAFEENKILMRFYENFQHLHNLKLLRMYFSSDIGPEEYESQHYLSQGILKRIPTLKKLTFIGAHRCCGLNKAYRSLISDLYLPQFFQSFHHLSQTLETLNIGHEKIIFSSFDLSSSKHKFAKLSTLTVTGRLENSDVNILLFLEQILSLGSSIKNIKLNTFIDNKIQSLLSLLQQLNKLSRPENLQLDLQIKFSENKSLEGLGPGFEDVMKKLQDEEEYPIRLHGVSLNLFTKDTSSDTKFLESYGKVFDSFNLLSSYAGFPSE